MMYPLSMEECMSFFTENCRQHGREPVEKEIEFAAYTVNLINDAYYHGYMDGLGTEERGVVHA